MWKTSVKLFCAEGACNAQKRQKKTRQVCHLMMTYLPGSVLWVGAAIAPTHSFILVYCSIGFIVGSLTGGDLQLFTSVRKPLFVQDKKVLFFATLRNCLQLFSNWW